MTRASSATGSGAEAPGSKPSPAWTVAKTIYGYLPIASSGACSYHGYQRNKSLPGKQPYLWGFLWAAFGAFFPIVAPVVAIWQGFARPK